MRFIAIRRLAGFLSLLTATALYAAAGQPPGLDPSLAVTQYIHEIHNNDKGLPQATINAVVQTGDGYIWFGTQEGLVRFDGLHYTVFDSANTPELPSNLVRTLVQDRGGTLWIGTPRGLVSLRQRVFRAYGTADGLPAESIQCLLADRDGGLWVGTGNGLAQRRGNRFNAYTLDNRPQGNFIWSLAQAHDGRILAGTNHGLYIGMPGPFTPYPGLVLDTKVLSLLSDHDGSLWVGTSNELIHSRAGRQRRYTAADGLSDTSIVCLFQDRRGTIWIGTSFGGLMRFHDGRFSLYSTHQGLPDNMVWSITEDREGHLWVGTANGCDQIQPPKIVTTSFMEGLSDDIVFTTAAGRDGAVWIGTNRGITRIRDGHCQRYGKADGLLNETINTLYEDRSGTLWVGTDNGLYQRHGERFELRPAAASGPPIKTVVSLYEDRQGTLWLTTPEGVFARKRGRMEYFNGPERLRSVYCNFAMQDRRGAMWFSLFRIGLLRWLDGKADLFSQPNGLAGNAVYSALEDEEGILWFATEGGLSRFEGGRFTTFNRRNGLPYDALFSIQEDHQGSFWISTNRGIIRVSRIELNAAAGSGGTVNCDLFGKKDGMKSAECNVFGLQSGCRDDEGRLWFPTIRGVVMIDPLRLIKNPIPPPVVVESMVVDDTPTPFPLGLSPLFIPPGRRKFEFQFAALSFAAPHQVPIRYKLLNYDTTWNNAVGERRTRYTDLPPGSYVFQVIAANADGVWNNQGASLPFVVRSFFWQSPLFLILAGLLLAGVVLGFVQFRLHRLKVRERFLQERVQERTEELAQANTELQVINSSLEKEIHERQQYEQRLHMAMDQLNRSNEKLQEMDRVKTDILHITTHELRTPLTSVVGFAGILQRRLREFTGTAAETGRQEQGLRQMAEYTSIIAAESTRMMNLVNDFLDMSRIEAGKMEWKNEPLQLAAIVAAALNSTSVLAEKKGLTLHFPAPAREIPVLYGDPERLIQVFVNLIGNAVKFTERGGVEITLTVEENAVIVRVRDSGLGIAAEDIPRLFQRFQRLGRAAADREGSGLGLVICKQIVEHHGGRIDVESTIGKGTTFVVTLPIR